MLKNKARRFFEVAEVTTVENEFSVALDGKTVRTPEGSLIAMPTRQLAELVSGEWSSQVEEIKPLTMPVMRLVCTAIDKVIPVRDQIIDQISRYGLTDLLCYRSEGPDDVVAHQAEHWQPVLDWLKTRFDISLNVTQGIVHVAQPESSLDQFKKIVGGYQDFQLTGLAEMTQLTGSLVLAIAFLEKHLSDEDVFLLSQLDDDWQSDKWGEDFEAVQRRKNLEVDVAAAVSFLAALD